MQKAHRRREEHVVEGRGSSDLRLLNDGVGDVVDLRGGAIGDVGVAEVGARGEDLRVTQVGEDGWWCGLRRAVAMAGEDVESKDRFGGGGEGEEEGKGEEVGGEHLASLRF